jgi:uncharacterized protein (UPF0332 family)
MNGEDLLQLASHLIVNTAFGNAEARYRTAVSRAYYGAYHIAVDFLSQLGQRVPGNHTGHEQVYRLLFKSNVEEAMDVARGLSELRSARNRADYDLRSRRFQSASDAMDKAELAHKVRHWLERCSVEPIRSAIMANLAGG